MRSSRSPACLLLAAIFSIMALASCGVGVAPGNVTPSNAEAALLRAVEKCRYGALVLESKSNDDIELVTERKRRLGKISGHNSDEVFCFNERDLRSSSESLLILFRRSATGVRGASGRWEYFDVLELPVRDARLWKIIIGPTNVPGAVPIFENGIK